ncbi:sodium/potassium/calcium exchanger 2 [Engraulis encrasicolus]|uniref:sodium/potassium/calcium exchanger 2 n=1 Tax=Engraulis encrasicolus TaxID=184585 RepID=UPI002FD6F765
MYVTRRKRLHLSRIIFFLSGVLLCCLYQLTVRARLPDPWVLPQTGDGPAGYLVEEDVGSTAEDATFTAITTTKRPTTTPQHPAVPAVASPPTAAASTETQTTAVPMTETSPSSTTNMTVHCIFADESTTSPTAVTPLTPPHPPEVPHAKADYPTDIFSVAERRQGWVALHIFGMIYMFVALAIVCDEFFVPTLGVITDKLEISDDVAGATFMAAGGSAPELFTSLIGVFISHSNVGIGTIVGSAVFNILFVIGMCALFSREVLHLTWWPLFRDVSFYILDLIMLIIFFLDNTIMPYESMMLIGGYTTYVIFMKFNVQLEQAFKTQLMKHKSIVKVIAIDEEPEKGSGTSAGNSRNADPEDKNRLKLKPPLQRGGSAASLHNSTMRSTIFQLMIHTLDPLGEVKFKDKAQMLNDMARGRSGSKSQEKADSAAGKGGASKEEKKEEAKEQKKEEAKKEEEEEDEDDDEEEEEGEEGEEKEEKEEKEEETAEKGDEKEKEEGTTEKAEEQKEEGAAAAEEGGEGSEDSESDSDDSDEDSDDDDDEEEDGEEQGKGGEGELEEEEEEEEEPLSLAWPETRRKQVTYLLLLPIVFPLWLTVPDIRNPASRRFFVITFVGSIIWIAVFSYLMVWWAHQVGETVGISEEIMGLTILAAGTSIPDLITSVIVARKGLGDMAVSSSVGSNIFDITVGLPVPWLLWSSINNFSPVAVSSNGLFCAIVLLFLMLLFVIISIASCKWKMNKVLGSTMFLLYFIFLVLSVMLEDRIIVCPVSI